eukprot:5584718-Pyramimonas_sp.AAC.1
MRAQPLQRLHHVQDVQEALGMARTHLTQERPGLHHVHEPGDARPHGPLVEAHWQRPKDAAVETFQEGYLSTARCPDGRLAVRTG